MSNWRLRSPNSFPAKFQTVVRQAFTSMIHSEKMESEWFVLDLSLTPSRAKYQADAFRCFRWCLREYTLHDLHPMEVHYEIVLRSRANSDGTKRLEVRMRQARSDEPLLAALAAG